MPRALITGASSGIGADLARAFVQGGHSVVLLARRRGRLEALAQELAPHAAILVEDLEDPSAPARIHATTGPIDVLVNNAGFGASGPVADIPLDRQRAMLQVNITALTELTRRYLPDMLARRSGRILNVASTAAFQALPGLAVYAATKAYVLSFSEALHSELENTGVTVTCLCPGATDTEFAAIAGMNEARLFRRAMNSAEVARRGYAATIAGKRLLVTGLQNRINIIGVRFAPRGLVLSVVRKLLLW